MDGRSRGAGSFRAPSILQERFPASCRRSSRPSVALPRLVFHDLDVAVTGTDDVLHWLAWNIPAKAGGIPEGSLPEGAISGTAGVGRGNYFGPGAPAGPRYHHYVFELFALSAMLDLPANATRAQLLDAMKDITVGKAAYVGRFRQKSQLGERRFSGDERLWLSLRFRSRNAAFR